MVVEIGAEHDKTVTEKEVHTAGDAKLQVNGAGLKSGIFNIY